MLIRPSWTLLDPASELAEPVCFLLNEFIKKETFPAGVQKSRNHPTFKKGNQDDPLNYRPISLTPELAKFLILLLNNQLRNMFIRKPCFLKHGPGSKKNTFYFRCARLCNCLRRCVIEKIQCNKNKKKITAAAF